jgi:hypothetical protein
MHTICEYETPFVLKIKLKRNVKQGVVEQGMKYAIVEQEVEYAIEQGERHKPKERIVRRVNLDEVRIPIATYEQSVQAVDERLACDQCNLKVLVGRKTG